MARETHSYRPAAIKAAQERLDSFWETMEALHIDPIDGNTLNRAREEFVGVLDDLWTNRRDEALWTMVRDWTGRK